MSNFFIIESPLQLINTYEAIHFFKLTNITIFIRYSNEKNNDLQLDKLLDYISFKECIIKKIYISSNSRRLSEILKIIFYKYYFKYMKTEKIFIGNTQSKFLSIIYKQFENEKIVMLDDGSGTIFSQKNYNNQNYYDLFTIYKLDPFYNQNIYMNDYAMLKKMIPEYPKMDKILFLGAKLSEIGIVREEYYLKLVANVSNYFNNNNIIYIPHRGESEIKLNYIKNLYPNISIKYLNYPVELYGAIERIEPTIIASFYSTALYSMQRIYNVNSIAFKFNYSSSKYKDSIEYVYKYYEKYLKVIELDD